MKVTVQCGHICSECGGCTGHRYETEDGTRASFNCDPPCTCPGSIRAARTMPLGDQVAAIAPFLERAAAEVVPDDMDRVAVLRRAIERFATIGARDHGDTLFHKSPGELLDEETDEFADAIIYRARRLGITQPLFLLADHRLTDEEADRIRADWKRKYGAGQ